MKRLNPTRQTLVATSLGIAVLKSAFAANQVPETKPPADLTQFSLEELLQLDVTSITKSAMGLKDVPSAIYVLNAEEIQRSGANSIPEALRLVPGLHVARIDGNKWAVSARGFNSQFATKLLVLMDGRSLYTPMFSVKFWDQLDVMMEDIERIEVIRGAGATLWGANAVNGVINIITKKTKTVQGGLLSGQGGTQRAGGGLRYGTQLGKNGYVKLFARYSQYDAVYLDTTRTNAGDDSQFGNVGFQFDQDAGNADKITLQGSVYRGQSGGADESVPKLAATQTPVLIPPYSQAIRTDLAPSGHYLLGRWQHQHSVTASSVLRWFWNHDERRSDLLNAQYAINTFDTDFQNNFSLGSRQRWVWGAGARINQNSTQNSLEIGWSPRQRQDEIYSVFAQDEIMLIPEQWKLTLGSKFEHNPVTQFEWQPSARLAWSPSARHAVWAAVSRAVRTPSWAEQDIFYYPGIIAPLGGGTASPTNPVTLLAIQGNKNMRSEKLLSFELGWRGQLARPLSMDVSWYFNQYTELCSLVPTILDLSHLASGYAMQTLEFRNFGQADIYGGEASLDWQVNPMWRLKASYAHAQQSYFKNPHTSADTEILFQNSFPTQQVNLSALLNLTATTNFDLYWRYVGGLTVNPEHIPAYQELDARLAWHPKRGLEIALVGRNLIHNQHPEFGSFIFAVPTAAQREFYATLRWEF